MNILVVYPNNYLEIGIPTGLATLSAILKNAGHKISLFDFTFLKTKELNTQKGSQKSLFKPTSITLNDLVKNDPIVNIEEEFDKTVLSVKPDLIIVSTMTSSYEDAINLLSKKQDSFSCKVLVGGVHPTINKEDALDPKVVDYICIGEGDEFILEFCHALENNKDPRQIQNLGYKENGEKIFNSLRPLVELDTLPTPDWSLFDERHLFRPYDGEVYNGGFYLMSRGCPYKCTYCVNDTIKKTMKGTGKYFRFQSPQTTIKQITELKEKYNATWFKFADDSIMSLSVEYLTELADGLEPLGIKFGCSIRPETTTVEKVLLLKRMGMVAASVGIESGNEEIRKKVLNRRMKNEQIISAIRALKENGVRVSTFNMIGVPTESRENVFETIELNKILNIDSVNVYILFPYPGTQIQEMYLNANIDLDTIEISVNEAQKTNLSQMSEAELRGLLKTFYLYIKLPYELWPIIKLAEKETNEAEMILKTLNNYLSEHYL